ncbi:MBL fold metallo-hydrolase [Streptomyces turgidiscabies]|uniref:Glyoxylase-like metal-dependent hydrolase (Beta-lactamase superfamily II) n=1 Tax=Streptomyces turgidiscabies TaxID=85558 RepID=A0ABU0RG49_9ACTN|nr:MBL fold metallo-hydrolase [Streptomyces turgidiscabies]MDQ0930969.1 glyoxylase-like metal-dependent hydrolase (beta-lactamase superfamily II) [Streptomyces turgidiscabies]
MKVTWEEPGWEDLGWERLAAGVGRCRLPVWDCTVGLVTWPGGALLIDAGSSLAEGAKVRLEAQALAGRRVDFLALTHAHFDHVFGAASFAGTYVLAAAATEDESTESSDFKNMGREALWADAVRNGLDPRAAEEAADALVVPHQYVRGNLTVASPGGREVVLSVVGPGHTRGDLAVVVRGDGGPAVVFCGDLVEESGEPQAGPDAVPSRWPAALDRVLALGGEDALYVPGHGAVVDAAFVRAQRDALATRFGVSREPVD